MAAGRRSLQMMMMMMIISQQLPPIHLPAGYVTTWETINGGSREGSESGLWDVIQAGSRRYTWVGVGVACDSRVALEYIQID